MKNFNQLWGYIQSIETERGAMRESKYACIACIRILLTIVANM